MGYYSGVIIGWAFFSLFLTVVWWIIAIFLCVWVYQDAKKRYPPESAEPVIWLLIVLLTGLIGLIIYLIVRPEEKAVI